MKIRSLLLIAALAAMALTPLAAGAETTLVSRTEVLNMNIGCNADTSGTCTTTEYWLGKGTGDNNVASANDFTPLGYASGGSSVDFPGDDTLKDTYMLRTDKPLTAVVEMVGWAGPVVAADSTVTVDVTAHVVGTPSFQSITLGSQTVNKAVDTDGTFDFSMDLDANLEGVVIDSVNVTVTKGSINVLTSGFMNGQGGSYIRLPYYQVVES